MVMDKGLSIREAEDFMSVGGEYTDMVKLGFGTSLITPEFEKKLTIYKKSGVVPYFGGTLFEAFIVGKIIRAHLQFGRRDRDGQHHVVHPPRRLGEVL